VFFWFVKIEAAKFGLQTWNEEKSGFYMPLPNSLHNYALGFLDLKHM
jgi:hypothetical protein